MPARKRPQADAKTRLERIAKLAREVGCDDDEAALKAKLAQIARQKSVPEPAPGQHESSDK